MRTSAYHLSTTRETPADAEIASHQLMIRSGMIRKLTAGIYTWSPLGLRVLRKVEAIVREEMDRAGYLELIMPAVQPSELWEETGRWEAFGGQLLKIVDRGEREYCFGPTHEEVMTDFVRQEIRSYKQLPITFYQIQTKFRDEIRPRFGVMRAREFLMKDAYSFHLDEESLEETFWEMHGVYTRIFERSGLRFRPVEADSGAIGGNRSIEFHVLADSGEDLIAFSDGSEYAANVELCPIAPPTEPRPAATEALRVVDTPGVRTIEDLVKGFDVPIERTIKTLLVHGEDEGLVALLVRGDHELNATKAEKLPGIASPLTFADEATIRAAVGAGPGSLGPVNLDLPMIADQAVAVLADFAAGANHDDQHCFGINFERDLPLPEVADLRNAQAGDPSPDGSGTLELARGIEVGHIFQLGTKYSESMGAVVLGEDGKSHPMPMGCYGIGVSRIVAAAIEQNHDDRGIRWPAPLAPFDLALLPMNAKKSPRVQEAAESLYRELSAAGVDVLYDDRNLRPGVMFNDMELIGIPYRLVVGERGLDAGTLEFRARDSEDNEALPLDGIVEAVLERLGRTA